MSTLSPLAPACVSPPRHRQDEVHRQNRSWRQPRAKITLTLQTNGTCEHDTGARWWIILSRLGPSEMNVLGPHHLISLSHFLSPAWFGFPPAHQNILSHMNPLDESLRNAQNFILDCVWPMEAYLPCVRLTEISTREKKKGRSKSRGVSSNRDHARAVGKVSLKVPLKEKKHMCLFSIAARKWWWCIRRE